MAGRLQDSRRIPRDRMRILGRYVLVLVLAGEGYYEDADGFQSHLRPGDAVLVPPERAHAYGTRCKSPWGQVFVVFDGPLFDLLQQSPTFAAHLPVWHMEPLHLWQRRLEEAVRPGPSLAPTAALEAVGNFAQLLIQMATTDAAARERPQDDWLEEGLRLLGEPHKGGWMPPQQVARRIGQSYDTFRKRFSARTGQAPGKFQKQRRIDLACAAIYQGSDNFKELAEKLGFCDVYHFSKVFRQVVGMPPAAYRKTVRGG